MRFVFLGTRGVPARYGGFETAIEEIGPRLAERGHEVIVYCRGGDRSLRRYRGMTLVHLPAYKRRMLETVSHSTLAVLHLICLVPADAIVLFNVANGPLLLLLRMTRIPVAVHVDGLEWKRAKWSGLTRRYLRFAEGWSVRLADAVIADATAISDYLGRQYGRASEVIAYGAPLIAPGNSDLAGYNLTARQYHLVVARLEPENNVDLIVRGYLQSAAAFPLVLVTSAVYSTSYEAAFLDLAGPDTGIRLVGPIWDQPKLDQLYANALTYIHGHSVGGTNPSLLRAMGAGTPVIAYDVIFNREATASLAYFFTDEKDVAKSITSAEQAPDDALRLGRLARSMASSRYVWDDVAADYEALLRRLAENVQRARR